MFSARQKYILRIVGTVGAIGALTLSGLAGMGVAHASSEPTVINGILPEASDDEAPEAPPAEKEASVEALNKESTEKSATTLASAAVTYTTVSVTGQMQVEDSWCVPASARMTLSAFGVIKTQTTLANLLGTTSAGTSFSKVPSVLNSFQNQNYYVRLSSIVNSTDLYDRVKIDVSSYASPTVTGLQGGDLVLWNEYGYSGQHAIVEYGYGSNGSFLQYDDPINIPNMYGKHVTNKSYIYQGIEDADGSLVW